MGVEKGVSKMTNWVVLGAFIIIVLLPTTLLNKLELYPNGYNFNVHEKGIEIHKLDSLGEIKERFVTKTWGRIQVDNESELIIPHHIIKDIKFWYIQLFSAFSFLAASLLLFFYTRYSKARYLKSITNASIVFCVLSILFVIYAINIYPEEKIKNLHIFINEFSM